MTAKKGQTVKSWLKELSNTDTSDTTDSRMMQNLLIRMGYSNAKVVSGIVYLEGHGTINNPPQSIHSIAKVIYETVKDVK